MSKQRNPTVQKAAAALIIDNGSFEVKAGLAGKKGPDLVFPSIVAVEQLSGEKGETVVGKEALKKIKERKKSGKQYSLRYPIQRGMLMDWEHLEHLWRGVFAQLNVAADAQPVLVTAQPTMPDVHGEGIAEMFFELFGAQQLFIETPQMLSFMRGAEGEENGICCDLGAGCSFVTPIVKGKVQHKNIIKYPVAGNDVSLLVSRSLSESGYVLDPSEEYRIVQHVKQNMAYVCQDLKFELEGFRENPKNFEQELELPSGEKLLLSKECFLSCESLFDPSIYSATQLLSNSHAGIHNCIMESIRKSAPTGGELERAMFSNIVLAGGTSQLPGFNERVEREIRTLVKNSDLKTRIKKVGIKTVEPAAHSAWLGGSDWCTAAAQGDAVIDWISRKEYNESGKSIVKKKCF